MEGSGSVQINYGSGSRSPTTYRSGSANTDFWYLNLMKYLCLLKTFLRSIMDHLGQTEVNNKQKQVNTNTKNSSKSTYLRTDAEL